MNNIYTTKPIIENIKSSHMIFLTFGGSWHVVDAKLDLQI